MATSKEVTEAVSQAETVAASKKQPPLLDRFLGLLSSVPLGVTLLCLLIIFSMIGMLIQQIELDTFRDYYAKLTPAEQLIYGKLGFFNIYQQKYFNLLLLVLSLNIILASIDYFPRAWNSVMRKKLTASPTYAQSQKVKAVVELDNVSRNNLAELARKAAKAEGFKTRVTEAGEQTTVFAERGVWNRFGAYYIHVGLLTIFLGGFLTSTRSTTGGMWLEPGKSNDTVIKNTFSVEGPGQASLALPFEVECTDFQQRLIDNNKGIETANTLDWMTRVRVRNKETGEVQEALVRMNKPFDYYLSKGSYPAYRFFQTSVGGGSARTINLKYTPTGGAAQEVTIKRNGETKLADGATLRYIEFLPDFQVDREGNPVVASNEFSNPAAHLEFISPTGERKSVWAFNQAFLNQVESAPFLKSTVQKLNGGPQFVLGEFEKTAVATQLSVQYDPGATVFYIGSAILGAALLATFLFAHQRLWIVVENGRVWLGGDANRNKLGFEDRVKRVAARIQESQAT